MLLAGWCRNGAQMTVAFYSNNDAVTKSGFRATWQSLPAGPTQDCHPIFNQ